MEFFLRLSLALYMPLLPYTLLVMGALGLGVTLYTHQAKFLLYSLLLSLPLNIAVSIFFLLFVAKVS